MARDARALRLAQPRPLPAFTLTDQHGQPFRSREAFAGRVSLVFFGFVNCPDVCPTTLLRLRNLLAADPALAQVQVVMVSVDGERDTPARLKRLLDAISPRFVGLTGDPARVRPVARSFSASFVRQAPSGPEGAYLVDHSAQLYLVGRDGRLSTLFFNASDEALRDALRAAGSGG
jgi:protein SCO1/2